MTTICLTETIQMITNYLIHLIHLSFYVCFLSILSILRNYLLFIDNFHYPINKISIVIKRMYNIFLSQKKKQTHAHSNFNDKKMNNWLQNYHHKVQP